MDEIDRKILKLLQDNARVSLKTIAENTFLSSPAVSARIERLEKEGIITGYHASVDPVKLGYHILAYINLEVIPEDKEQFYAYAREVPHILAVSYTHLVMEDGAKMMSGSAAFMLVRMALKSVWFVWNCSSLTMLPPNFAKASLK